MSPHEGFLRTDPWPYASAEEKARHSRSVAREYQRMLRMGDDLTAQFARQDAARNPAFAKDWADRQASFTPDIPPALNVPHVDLVRRVA